MRKLHKLVIIIASISLLNSFQALGQTDPCDVNLIEVAVVDITGLNGQPDFDNAHICSVADTVRIELGSVIVTLEVDAAITAATSLVNIAEITSSENIDGDIQSDIDSTPDDVQGNEDGQVDYYIDDDLKDQTILQKAVVDQKFHNTFHLFSHGQSGELLIRGVWKDHIQIKNWIVENNFPIRNKQLNIYGCNFAEGEKGQHAVSYLETALGVSIAASDDLTGRNGDWDLEVGSVFQHIQIDNYNYNLSLSPLWDDFKSWVGSFFEADEENQTQAISMMMTCGGVVGGTAPTDDFDGDGNCNDVDIDDDNDGILDVDEGCVPMPYDMTDLTWTGDAGMSVSASSSTLTGGSSNWKSALSDQVFTLPLDVSFTYTIATGLTMFGFAPEGSALNNNWTINSAYGFYIRGTRTDARTGITTAFLQNNTTVKPHRITIDAAGNLTLYIDGAIVYTEAGLPTDNYQFYISNFNSPNKPFEDISFAENGSPTISLLDTDEDGIPNCFDLDSDGDGCYDSYEAGVTGATNDGSVTDSLAATTNAEVGMNGYANSLETAEDGVPTFTSTYNPFALRDDIDGCVDTDGDGIRDVADLDDDNDGILDTDEDLMACSSYSTIDITSGAGGAVLGSTTLNYTISTTGTSQTIGGTEDFGGYTWDNRFLWQRPDDAYTVTTITFSQPVNRIVVFVSDNADDEPGYVEVIGTQARIITTNNASRAIVSASGDRVTSLRNTTKSIVEFVDLNGRTEWNVGWYNDLRSGTTSTGDDRGAIAICSEALGLVDTDDDGIVNSLDPDSDNDGCPDAIEGGGSFTDTDVIAADGTLTDGNGDVANTNLGNTVDMDPASAAYGVPTTAGAGQAVGTSQLADVQSAECPVSCGMVDTDGDGVFDLCDLDDDNDGILDTDEGCEIVNTDMRALTWTGDATMSVSATDGTTLVGASTSGWKTSLSDQVFTLPLEVSFTYTVAAGNTMFGFAPEGSALNDNWNIDSAYGFYIAGTSSYRRTGTAIVIEQNSTLGLTHRISIDAAGNFTLYIDGVIVYTEAGLPTDNYQFYVATRDSPDKPIEDISFAANGNPAICLLDTDDDGIPNGLDTDSDNDGCYDSYEAGVTGATNDGSVTDSLAATTNAEVGNNGYANSLETAEDGVATYTSNYDPYAIRDDINACADTDGDGIADVDDLDDDNDGILDIDEDIMACSSFGTIDITGTGGNVVLGSTTVNYTISNTGTPDLLGGSENYDGIAWNNRFLWAQPWDDYEVTTITFSQPVNRLVVFAGDMADDDPGYVEVVGTHARILSAAGPTVPGGVYVSASGDRVYSNHLGNKAIIEFIDPYGRTEWNIGWNNDQRNSNSNTGDDRGAYAICEAALGLVDTDDDGIVNSLDTDSDNDGCPDAIEGGGSFTDTDVTTAGGTLTDGNGDGANTNLGNTVDTDPASASYGVPTTAGAGQTVGDSQDADVQSADCPVDCGMVDTDGDGIFDLCDLDDDNDGILDIFEQLCEEAAIGDPYADVVIEYSPVGTIAIDRTNPENALGAPDNASGQTNWTTLGTSGGYLILGFTDNNFSNSGDSQIDFRGYEIGAVESANILGRPDATTKALLDIQGFITPDPDGFYPLGQFSGSSAGIDIDAATNNAFPALTLKFNQVKILSTINSGDGADIDAVEALFSTGPCTCVDQDTDDDGIVDSLDTDSDNDGCPDAIEGGGSFTDTDVTTAGGTLTDGNGDGANTNLGNTVDTDPASASYGVPTTAGAGQTVGDSQDANNDGCLDADGDGIADIDDLDDDNDGILDTDEEDCPDFSNISGGSGMYPDEYYIINWDDPVFDDGIQDGDSKNILLPNGTTLTATFSNAVNLSGNTNITDLNTWSGAAAHKLYQTAGTKEAIYNVSGQTFSGTVSFSVTPDACGNVLPLNFVAIDAEATGGSERVVFTTNGAPWVPSETVGSGATYILSNNDQTVTYTNTINNYTLLSSYDATQIDFSVPVTAGGQGVAFGFRYQVCFTDTDGDCIINSLDTDSDNDGCPDAIEGGGSFTDTDVTTAGGTLTDGNGDGANTNLGNTVDTDPASASYGVPITAGAGQTVGDSQDAETQGPDCTLLPCDDVGLTGADICADITANGTMSIYSGLDCDGDGELNETECTNGTDPTDPCSNSYADGAAVCAAISSGATGFAAVDCDGGGVSDAQECVDGTDPMDPCDDAGVTGANICADITTNGVNSPFMGIDCDGDGETNEEECTNGTDPLDPCSNSYADGAAVCAAITNGATGFADVDCDGGGVSDAQECADGTDPLDPCDDTGVTGADICADIAANGNMSIYTGLDCDGDGVSNDMECADGTDPSDPCSNSYTDGAAICAAITNGATGFAAADCDGGGVSDAQECADGTDPMDPCDDTGLTGADICADISANGMSSPFMGQDCDGDGELNETECTNGTDPTDPCSNSYADGAAVCAAIANGATGFSAVDCDGGGVSDAQECADGTDPLDPCDDTGLTGADICADIAANGNMSIYSGLDCDGDGVFNDMECADGTDPSDPCSNSYADGAAVCAAIANGADGFDNVDCDGGGVSDAQECADGTDPLDPCDDMGLTGIDICADLSLNGTASVFSGLDCDGDGQYNDAECANGTDPLDPCSNSYPDGTSVCAAIANGATGFAGQDCDGGGVTDIEECANGTDPTNPMDDCAALPNGMTSICELLDSDPTNPIGVEDCDGDGQSNTEECNNGTDPTDPCSNNYSNGTELCAAISNGATAFANVDCDGGGVSDAQECADGTDPMDPCDDMGLTSSYVCADIVINGSMSPFFGADCDGGGVNDEDECADGTDPMDPCDDAGLTGSDICASITTEGSSSPFMGIDCDGDGENNEEECINGTDPSDPCSNSYADAAALCTAIANGADGFDNVDCDGGGVSDAQECADGTDPMDPCDDAGLTGSDICADITTNGVNSPFMGIDCDGDGENNEEECTNGTDPSDPCSNSYADAAALCTAIANGADGFDNVDCDGGGVSDAQECADGTDPTDPCDDTGLTGGDICADIVANGALSQFVGIDCDGDGENNEEECTNGTDPLDPCSNSYADGAAVCTAITNGATGFAAVDCDGGGVSDAQECADGTDPLDPCDDAGLTGSDICADIAANGNMSIYSGLDCDGDGVFNDMECADGTDPSDPCSNNYTDGAAVCAAIANGADGFDNVDCDGGGVSDAQECADGTDPMDPCDDAGLTGSDICADITTNGVNSPFMGIDCDGDGENNEEECTNGTDPLDPCSNSYADGAAVCAAIANGATGFAVADCDGGGVSDAQECADGTDPLDPCDDAGVTGADICADIAANGMSSPFMGQDCDGDGELNETECTNGTDPLDPCSNSYADGAAVCAAITNGATGFAAVDCDGGGVSDAQECTDGTDPLDPCDDAGVTGADICADIAANGNMSIYSGLDCDGDGVFNDMECADGTDPSDPCSNSYTDGAAVCAAIANGATGFAAVDCDGGGVSDAQECADGTDPLDPCDDMGLTGIDICADLSLNGTASVFSGLDCDGDGQYNDAECANGTDPLDPCSNSYPDGTSVCAAIANGATGFAGQDCDGGGVTDIEECANGTDPTNPMDDCAALPNGMTSICELLDSDPTNPIGVEDCDGDGQSNTEECNNGTDPTDPCSNNYSNGTELCAAISNGATAFANVDCDGGGVSDAQECADGTDPMDPCDDMGLTSSYVCADIVINGSMSPFFGADCDGGGVNDEDECADGTDPMDPCDDAGLTGSDICASITTEGSSSPFMGIDCDGDGENNEEECMNGTDPLDPCSNSYADAAALCTAIANGADGFDTVDCDGGGVSDAQECADGTDPMDPCDDAGLTGSDICADITTNGVNSPFMGIDCDGDGENNEEECTNGTDPSDPCSNSYADAAALCTAIANGADGFDNVDCDGGGVSDAQECADGTDPTDPCDDTGLTGGDICADIVANGALSQFVGIDCDGDGENNEEECTNGTDPLDPCSNSYADGAAVCTAITNGATGFAAVDCDGGGVSDAQECADGTDPLDPCDDAGLTGSDICADIAANGNMSIYSGLDCDGDGVFNDMECADGTDPSDPCSNNYTDGAAVCAAIANGADGFDNVDCDGGGVSNAQECADGTDPMDPCDDAGLTGSDICADITTNGVNSPFMGIDCDGDGENNEEECTNGTDPLDPCSNSYADGAAVCTAITNGATGFAAVDCDGGGVSDAQECADGTDPLDPCDDAGVTGADICADIAANGMSSPFMGQDCDGDGELNETECTNGTDPLDPCSNSYADGAAVCAAISNGADGFAAVDCDGGGVSDAQECADGTDPIDPCDDAGVAGATICAFITIEGSSSVFYGLDCDGDGENNEEECINGTDPSDPCSNSYADAAALCTAIANGADGFDNVDCDGGGVSDAQECADGTDPMDPCDDAGLTGSDICADITTNGVNSPFMGIDCDGDGENNEEECTNGTDPSDPCSNSYADAAALCTAIGNGADGFDNVDCDGGGVSDAQECADGTDPTDPCDDTGLTGGDICADIVANGALSQFVGIDCDGDGENNEEECTNGTDPLDPCSNSYADGAAVCTAITNGATGFAAVDCDGGGVSDAQECADGTDPLDPCDDAGLTGSDICADIAANGNMSIYSGLDCDGDGVFNDMECADGTDPSDPCDPGFATGEDLCAAMAESPTLGDLDCDGDGETNAEECENGTDPTDPCDHSYETGAEMCAYILANPDSPLALADCDQGGVDNLTECDNGGDPLDDNDDCDAILNDIVDVCALLISDPTNPLATSDCDGDGIDNATECDDGTDPSDPCDPGFASGADLCAAMATNPAIQLLDCDGDGFTNQEECEEGTDPTDPCDNLYTDGDELCAFIAANPGSPLATADCDMGGVDNATECEEGTDPLDPEDDCDLVLTGDVDVCALLSSNPSNELATADCDGDGIDNATECEDGTDPTDPCDPGTFTAEELCDLVALNPDAPIASADCDNGGIDNDIECADGTDPTDPGDDMDPCEDTYNSGAELCAAIATDPALGLADCDNGGIDNQTECNNGGDPLDPSDDCDMIMDGLVDVCALLASDPTNALATADCDGDGIDNATECDNGTDPSDPCDPGFDSGADLCAALVTAPTLGAQDCDGDGVDNQEECDAGTDPTDPCDYPVDEGVDICELVMAAPNGDMAMADCDDGGIDNMTECENGLDPEDPSDDCDLVNNGIVDVCALLVSDPTNPMATADCDGDGIDNATECADGTDPSDPCDPGTFTAEELCDLVAQNPTAPIASADCDNGGIANDIECADGTDSTDPIDDMDPCEEEYSNGAELCAAIATYPALGLADCDNGGIDNQTECDNGGDPLDPSDDCDMVIDGVVDLCMILASDPMHPMNLMDCDGDGIDNVTECDNGTDPSDPCDPGFVSGADLCAAIATSPNLGALDCDMDGETNQEECDKGTDPIDPCDNSYSTGEEICAAISNGATGLESADCDNGGIDNETECDNGTDATDPYDDNDDPCSEINITEVDICAAILVSPSMAAADCDGDGKTNQEECDNGTDPSDPCDHSYANGDEICEAVANGLFTNTTVDCDQGGISDVMECMMGTDPTDPSDDNPCDSLLYDMIDICTAATNSLVIARADCDEGGIDNLTECQNGGDPSDPSDDCDLVLDQIIDVCKILDEDPENTVATMDCDEDGSTNAEECEEGTDPTDPCDNLFESGEEMCAFILANPTSSLALADCDEGGINNLIECMNGTDPLDPDDDCEAALSEGIDLCQFLEENPDSPMAGKDCDEGGIDNKTECEFVGTFGFNPNPADPADDCDFVIQGIVDVCALLDADPANPLGADDCDGDGISNLDECNAMTDPADPCDPGIFTSVELCSLVMADPESPLALADCDNGGIINIVECMLGDDPLDPVDDCRELACFGNINLSLDDNCESVLSPAMLLAVVDYPDQFYMITLEDQWGNPVENDFDYTEIGNCYSYSVIVPSCNGQSCWGTVCIEDKFPPQIDCGPVQEVFACSAPSADLTTVVPPTISTDNCDGAELMLVSETITPNDDCDPNDLLATIVRCYKAVDAQGNESPICCQTIEVKRIVTGSIVWPPPFSSTDCTTSTGVGVTGVPTIGGVPIFPSVPNDICNLMVSFEDVMVQEDGCHNQFLRMWSVSEWWCGGLVGPITHGQLIEVRDVTPPTITCPADMTVTTGSSYGDCESTFTLPPATVSDDCNSPVEVDVITGVGFIDNSNGGEATLTVGTHTITYVAYDGCYNSSECTMEVTVVDEHQPTILCDEFTVVTLTNTGYADVYADVFDDGSFDDCGIDRFEARRMNDACDIAGNDEFGEHVTFCCADIGDEVMVVLRVYDTSGNFNDCMVMVEVQDKSVADIMCIPDETIYCPAVYDINNLTPLFGIPTIIGATCTDDFPITEATPIVDVNNCGIGTITRNFSAPNGQGGVLTCTQVIEIINNDPFDGDDPTQLQWPLDFTTTSMCDFTDATPDNLPTIYSYPIVTEDECDLVGWDYEDQEFTFANDPTACFKILRTWTVIDWCQRRADGTFEEWTHVQEIKILNDTDPVITSGLTNQVVESIDISCNSEFVTLGITAEDDCPSNVPLNYSYEIDLGSNGVINQTGNTNDASGTYPIGVHTIYWLVLDGCGNEAQGSSTFEVRNIKAPVAICLAGLSIDLTMMDTDGDNIPDTNMAILWASDFDKGSYHPCGYPVTLSFSSDVTETNITFDCDDLGQQGVQLWVTDSKGNQSFCSTFIIVQDNDGDCPTLPGTPNVGGRIFTEDDINVEDVEVELLGSSDSDMTEQDGNYAFDNMPMGGSYTIDPGKNDDFMNGISTLDLVLIQKHLLQFKDLDSPYKRIAADVNKDERISSIDLIQLRKLILGIYVEFPENESWRFVDALHLFPDVEDPWFTTFEEKYDISDLDMNMWVDFIGVKIGDVNGSVEANFQNKVAEKRSGKTLRLKYADRKVFKDEEIRVSITAENFEHIAGLQYTLEHRGLKLEGVEAGSIDITDAHIGKLDRGLTTFSWNDLSGKLVSIDSDKELFTIVFKSNAEGMLSDALNLNNLVTKVEAYQGASLEILNVALESKEEIIVEELMALYQNEPNPWSNNTIVKVRSFEDRECVFTVTDTNGKLVLSKTITLSKGMNEIVLTNRDVQIPGVYSYSINMNGQQMNRNMIKIN